MKRAPGFWLLSTVRRVLSARWARAACSELWCDDTDTAGGGCVISTSHFTRALDKKLKTTHYYTPHSHILNPLLTSSLNKAHRFLQKYI